MTLHIGGNDARQAQHQTTILDDSWTLRSGRRDMSYRRRGDSGYGARFRFLTLWPKSGMMSGDRTEGYCLMGQDIADSDVWSPWQRAIRGNGATKFILGQCKDGNGDPVGGAVVQGFLTATDQIVAEVACDDSGRYELPTVYPSPATHYLVAYRDGSPAIAGTTVNTLTGTNRDGT